ncbi:MAG: germination protein YpeB [Clostridia bacterium]|nr:germination protein YpeB [Clostridia bacterium]
MDKEMKKSLTIFVPLLLVCAFAAALVYAIGAANRLSFAERQLNNNSRNIYMQIHDNLNDIDTSLQKLTVSNDPSRQILLFADVWRLSNATSTALSQISSSHADDYGLYQFIVRTGDYCHTLMQQLLLDEKLTDTDTEQLASLQKKCSELSVEIRTNIENGQFPTYGGDGGTSFYESYQDEESISDYPHLIYDGPFSESSEEAQVYLEGEDVDEAKALEIAREYFPEVELIYDGLCEGVSTESHDFSGDNLEISITKKGGQLLYFMRQPESDLAGEPSTEETNRLHASASDYLKAHGYEAMVASYAQYYSGVVVINYAASQDGVILYSDLIKVYIDRQSHEVIGLDAKNYVSNHRSRSLDSPSLTRSEAEERVSINLKIESCELALIPKTSTTEVLCYEFKGVKDDTFFIVYINAKTGHEEQIFEVINSEEGDLVV